MYKFLIALLFIMSVLPVCSQRYDTAAGLRVGNAAGLTIQQRVSNRYTVEGMLLTNLRTYTEANIMGQYHGRIMFQKRFNWYVGGGIHIGGEEVEGTTYGPGIITGLEMSINRYNMSFDYLFKNYMNETDDAYRHYIGVSLRYIIKKRPRKTIFSKINLRFWDWGKKDK